MQRPTWARLAHPFSPSARAWVLLELSADRLSARVAPRLAAEAIRARLDEVVSPGGWSSQVHPLGVRAAVCNLTVDGVGRSGAYEVPVTAVPGSPLATAGAIVDAAFAAAAAQFGMVSGGEAVWVDHDPETGEVLVEAADPTLDEEEAPVLDARPLVEQRQEAGVDERPEAHVVIDRLVERLKAEGLGADAAKLVVRYGGYGRTAEESRELYGRLRSLLMGKVSVPS